MMLLRVAGRGEDVPSLAHLSIRQCANHHVWLAERCTACDICVKACPANVFEAVPEEQPVIARQQDCQTCFLCEIYCPVDAPYVSPIADVIGAPESELASEGLLGSYARALGWRKGKPGGADRDPLSAVGDGVSIPGTR